MNNIKASFCVVNGVILVNFKPTRIIQTRIARSARAMQIGTAVKTSGEMCDLDALKGRYAMKMRPLSTLFWHAASR